MSTAVDIAFEGDTADLDGVNHYTCRRCHPEPYPGIPAVCGVELLGIDPVWEDTCRACVDGWPQHEIDHLKGKP